jgi:hypothetical protein
MGTRSLIKFQEDGETLVCVYQQYDGHPDSVGAELAGFLLSKKMVNGLGGYDEHVANGMGCLAAQFIALVKSEPGGTYIYPPNCEHNIVDYVYIVSCTSDGKKMHVKVFYSTDLLFNGDTLEFAKYCDNWGKRV